MMRSYYFLMLLAILIATSAQLSAQNDKALRLGVQTSPTVSWLGSNENLVNPDISNVGLELGLIAEYYFQPNYALVSGMSLLMGQGGGLTYNYASGGNFLPRTAKDNSAVTGAAKLDTITVGTNIRYKVQYLEIPFALKLRSNEVGYMRYFATLPMFSVGFRTQAKADIDWNTLPLGVTNDIEKENVTEDVVGLMLSWGFGAGLEYSISDNVSAVAGLYYKGGLTDVTRDKGTQIFPNNVEDGSKARMNTIVIRIGVLF